MRHVAAATLVLVISYAVVGAQQSSRPEFVDVAQQVGLVFSHVNGATPQKYLPETMSGGAIFLDYDSDGWPDIFLVNGGSLADNRIATSAQHRLFRNTRKGKFVDVTESSGIRKVGYGMGACSADYDNDGFPDLYVTAFGPNQLYHNLGSGTFTDVTATSGTGSAGLDLWSTGCAFADIDNDGDVDLYVTRYVDFTVARNKTCIIANNTAGYCHPNAYNSLPDVLYRNNGDGTFTDVTPQLGVKRPGNGLGVVFGDYDNDGWIDIYVSNDSTPNFLFHNKGKGVFEEVGLWAGVAVGADGESLAGMGTDIGDVDNDGLLDIFVANLDSQTHTLYKNLGKGLFADATFLSGIGPLTLPYVGFGSSFLDFDNDTDLDLAIANGHVLDNVKILRPSGSYEQLNLLLENDGTGKFKNVGPLSGSGFASKRASRALAVADFDNDGDQDILISNTGTTPELLRNDGGNRQNFLSVETKGVKSNRSGVGARLTVSVNGKTLIREVKAGSSYLAQNELRVHFGLGHATSVDRLEVRWPSGVVDVIKSIDANRFVSIQEGRNEVESLVR